MSGTEYAILILHITRTDITDIPAPLSDLSDTPCDCCKFPYLLCFNF